MKIIWPRRAIGHLTSLRRYVAEEAEGSAAPVARRILDAVALPATQPEIGRPGRIVGTRELVVPQTLYVIPYRIRRERLELPAVFDGRQRWPTRL